jgi:PAS domain S-box-containing protein
VAGNCTKVVVADFWKQLFDPNAFMPHIHCYLWNTGLVRLHVISDLAIGFSYVAISITLAWLIWRARQDVPFSWMFLSFGAFILACGATHFVEVWTLWTPLYWLAGLLKAVTAGASVITAVLLPSLIPKAIDLIRLSKETEAANHELRQKAAVLENSAEAVVSLSLDCRITGWNCAAERMFGYTAHEVAGRPISILAPPELSRETQEAVRRYMTGEGPSSFETVRVRKNGDKFEVNEILSLTMDRDGKVREISLVKRDITKRKLGEEILRVAVEAAPNAIVMADQAGKIRLVNAQTEILFGYAREELLGQSVEVLVPERDRRGHPVTRSEFMAHPPAGSTGAARELCGLRKDGIEFPMELGLNPIRMSGETWILSAISDITERKRAKQEIAQLNRELERRVEDRTTKLFTANLELMREISDRKLREVEIEKLNAEMKTLVSRRTTELEIAHEGLRQITTILDNSIEAIISLALDYRITGWNRAAERMFGYSAADVLGRPISILAPPELATETQDAIDRFARGEGAIAFETIRVRKSGEKIDVHAMLSPITNAAGEIQGISVVKRDITDRKLGYEILRVAADAGPSAMVMADQKGMIVLVNAQTEKLFGYRREELVGQSVDILVPDRYRGGHRAVRADFMAKPGARSMEAGRGLYAVRKDGSEFPVEIGLNQIRMSGETWVLSAIVDITERKRAREAILQANEDLERRVNERTEELSRANADLEAFSYTVAHDLRAPLRHIAGFANLLALECRGEMSDEARRHLERVQNGAQSMGNLIDALLHLARIGRQPVSPKPTALNALVDAALAGLAPELAGRKIEWRIRDLGIADCDPGLMQQVFVNLLSNAIKYTRLQEIAQIEVARSTVDGEPVFFVRDNGAGFDMQYAGRLFDVFHRLHKARDFEGTGVGLATVQRIIHNHGGRVWAHAEMGKGATFSFAVPEVCAKKMELA